MANKPNQPKIEAIDRIIPLSKQAIFLASAA
jgi:hypothetical protein